MSKKDLINQLIRLPLTTQGQLIEDLDPNGTDYVGIRGNSVILHDRHEDITGIYTSDELAEHWANYIGECNSDALIEVGKAIYTHKVS